MKKNKSYIFIPAIFFVRFYLITISICCFQVTNAQISNYTFATGTYPGSSVTPSFICGNNNLIEQPVTKDGQGYYVFPPGQMDFVYTDCIGSNAAIVAGPGFPIGFNFIYDGQVFDRLAISANGYIKLGKSGQDIMMYNDTLQGGVFADGNNALRANVISVIQNNVPLYTSGIIMDGGIAISTTGGLPGQRAISISWTYFSVTPPSHGSSANLFLYEGSNKIEATYRANNPLIADPTVGISVGLRGKEENNNINNLNTRKVVKVNNTWATSIAGSSATDFCDLGPTSPISPDYLSFTWTPLIAQIPPVCPFIYLTYFIFGNGPSDPIPSDYPSGLMPGIADGDGSTGQGILWYEFADGATNVPRNPILKWPPAPDLPTTYDVYFGTDNPAVTLVSHNQTDTSYAPPFPYLAPNTDYYYKIIAKNAYGSSPGCTGKFTTGSVLQYCDRMRPGSLASNINFNTIAFTYSNGADAVRQRPEIPLYTTTIQRNGTYTFSITPQNPLPFGEGTYIDTRIYFDWNQDGDFDDAGETYIVPTTNVGSTSMQSITVPNNAVLGKTLMRVRTAGQNDPAITSCNPYAATTDFVITIAPTTACANFTINPTVTNANCFGENNGSINLNPSGGAAPYTVIWTDGNSAINRINLTRGTYQASSVTDANGCEVSTPLIPVLQPGALSIDTARDSNNMIHLLVSGGTGPYNYLWSNDSTSSDPNNFIRGTYSVKVADAHGCDTTIQGIVISKAIIIPPPADSVQDSSININIYPNPTSSTIYLKSQKQQYIHIQIISEQGKIMNDGNYTIGNYTIGNYTTPVNITTYPAGMYFLKIVGDKSTRVVKIVKALK